MSIPKGKRGMCPLILRSNFEIELNTSTISIEVILTMRKVELTMKENNIYKIIKKLVETNGSKHRAAIRLNCSERNINILIKKYNTEGKNGFSHKNKLRKPSNTISDELRKKIIKLYKEYYYDCNWTHYKEKLIEDEKIEISYTALSHILTKAGFISPLCNRATKRRKKQELEDKKNLTEIDKNVILDDHILDSLDAHPRRPRAKYFGELIQMDASGILWFNNIYSTLHLAVDDALGAVVGAYFDYQETLNGYYNVFNQILRRYGIPNKFFTDNRTVFTYNSKSDPTAEHDTYTQFAYACKSLGVEIETSSVPQKKGRIERLNQTFQNRLPQEMRLAKIKTIEEANKFLESYVIKFNKRFSLYKNNISSVFEKQVTDSQINLTLSILTPRIFDSGSAVKFQKEYYQAIDQNTLKVIPFMNHTKALLIKAFNEELYITVNEHVYLLQKLESHKKVSKNFDEFSEIQKTKAHVPPMTHPWKRASFEQFMLKQKHRNQTEVGANI